MKVLGEHVHAQHDHFAFIARERVAGPPAVRAAIRHQIELVERELATDLARLTDPDYWSTEDLRVLSNLIVTSMVGTAEAILTSRPEAERTIRRAGPHPAPDAAGRRAALAHAAG